MIVKWLVDDLWMIVHKVYTQCVHAIYDWQMIRGWFVDDLWMIRKLLVDALLMIGKWLVDDLWMIVHEVYTQCVHAIYD